jgi:hypothetical protein
MNDGKGELETDTQQALGGVVQCLRARKRDPSGDSVTLHDSRNDNLESTIITTCIK